VEATRQTTHELVQDVMINSTLPDTTERTTPLVRRSLPCPVILPQRRPHKRARGFVRAYAPVLADTGIDQDTFLKFLKNLHKSSQASPIFKIIGISAGIAGLTPSIIAMVVCTSVEVAARAGAEVQRRYRTNDFLDQMNASLFVSDILALAVGKGSDSFTEAGWVVCDDRQIQEGEVHGRLQCPC
jgi:hypothetical protein